MSYQDADHAQSTNSHNSSATDDINYCPSKLDRLLDYIWPIKSQELVKFLLITMVMFGILGIQNLIRALKDSLVNTMIGTETISFLKFWGVMPASLLITIAYIKLTNFLKGETIFYLIISLFLMFFILFAFVLFPNYELIHLAQNKANYLVTLYPHAKWFILILSNWSFSLFYIIAELWPNVVYALLFWQFVNKIIPVDQSTRFYPLFGIFSQTGLILSGLLLANLTDINNYVATRLNLNVGNSELTIKVVLSVVILLGIFLLLAFWILNNKILDKDKIQIIELGIRKSPLSLYESIKIALSSKYILLVAMLLICYGMAINLIEGPWKFMLSKVYNNPTEYTIFVGKYLQYTGVFTIAFSIVGSNLVRRFGWFYAALVTPVMIIVTGGLFFFIIYSEKKIHWLWYALGIIKDPMLVAIIIGAIQNVLSKSSKYAIFDSTKEMAYVPLEYSLKTRGKAAADLMGTKLGKSTSAFIQTLIFIIFPAANFGSILHYLMFVFIAICFVWIVSVIKLNKEYKVMVDKHNDSLLAENQ